MAYYVYLKVSQRDELRNIGWDEEMMMAYDKYARGKEIKKQRLESFGRATYSDSMKNKLYRAEQKFMYNIINTSFDSIDEIQKYVDSIINTKTWKKLNGPNQVPVRAKVVGNGRGFSAQASEINGLVIGTGGMNKYVVFHELAHMCGHWHHGVSFRNCVLSLVSRFMGTHEASILKRCFKEAGLKLKENTTILPPEKWLVGYKKMQKARAAKV